MSDTREEAGEALVTFAHALRAGDERAAGRAEVAAREHLTRFCAGYLDDHGEAEDVVQEVLTRLVAAPDMPPAPRAWLLRVARNLCLDRLRARGARPDRERLASSFDVARESAGPVTRMVGAEGDVEVLAAFATLGAGERELLRLRYAEGLPRAEVAEILGLDESLVKSRLYETIQKLRRAVAG